MHAEELDRIYTELSEAVGRAGEARATLMLATLALDLMTRGIAPAEASAAIVRAERLSAL